MTLISKFTKYLMKHLMFVAIFFLIVLSEHQLLASEIKGRVIDGLNRPVGNAEIKFSIFNDKQLELIVTTDKNGYFKMDIGENTKDVFYYISKKGYFGHGKYFDINQDKNIVFRRVLPLKETKELAKLRGDKLQKASLEVLASEIYKSPKNKVFGELFKINEHIESAIISILESPHVENKYIRDNAVRLLSYFANPKTLKQIVPKIRKWLDEETTEIGKAQICFIAGALLSPTAEEEWAIHEKCISNRGTLAFKAISDEKSFNILKAIKLQIESEMNNSEAVSIEKDTANWGETLLRKSFLNEINGAIRFIEEHPKGIRYGSNINTSIKNASAIISEKEEEGKFKIDRVIYDQNKNKAMVSMHIYHGPLNARSYDMVFHKISGVWILRGIWLTWVS